MRIRASVISALAVVLSITGVALAAPYGCQSSSVERSAPPTVSLQKRHIVFVGASASDGYKLGADVCMANTFGAQLAVGGYQPLDFSDCDFWKLSDEKRAQMVADAVAAKPNIVVATDFLFWYLHCTPRSEEKKRGNFEKGLKLLEDFICPVLVGDIPDVASAAEHVPMLRFVLPSGAMRIWANERVRAWVDERNLTRPTLLIPLADAVAAQMAGTPLRIGDREYQTVGLLQEDHLHPTFDGQVMLCRLVQQTLIDGKLFRRSDFK